jgi:hypothetical protein
MPPQINPDKYPESDSAASPHRHRALKRLAARDQPHAAGAFVDDGRLGGFAEIVFAAGAAAVDQRASAHVAVGQLIAAQLDRMIAGRQLAVDALDRSCRISGRCTAVIFRQFLLDDVRLNRHAQMIRLPGQIGGT